MGCPQPLEITVHVIFPSPWPHLAQNPNSTAPTLCCIFRLRSAGGCWDACCMHTAPVSGDKAGGTEIWHAGDFLAGGSISDFYF